MTSPTDRIARALWIDTSKELEKFLNRACVASEYFLDTEFHREKTYFPQLALVQIGINDEIALIDPSCLASGSLARLFEGHGLCVVHAAQQDLDVLSQSIGSIPNRIFDTQLAAGFLGFSTPSLVSLLATFLKVTVPKGDRLTDWLRRPLTTGQLSYAAGDVAYLPELRQLIVADLEKRNRLAWALEACEELRVRPTGPIAPDNAWMRVKDVRTLKGKSRWVARSVARWREIRAAELDIPVRHVLSDMVILGIAAKAPRNELDLGQTRGIDRRQASGATGESILTAVATGVHESDQGDLHFPTPDGDDLDRSLRPAVTLVSAWITELARQQDLDAVLLGTRQDIVDLLRHAPNPRLATGWRADIVGRDVQNLLEGRVGLTFRSAEAGGGLELQPISDTHRTT